MFSWSIVLGEVDHGNLRLFLFLGLWVCVVLELHFGSDVPTTMVLHALVVQHEGGGTSYTVDYDSDDGEETLKVQLFSLTGVLPENQKLVGLSDIRNGKRFLTLVEEEEEQQERTISQDPSTGISPGLDLKRIAILDEELARALELEDAVHANSYPPQRAFAHTRSVREAFESELLPYFHRWAMYEDVARQNAARATLSLDELEEDALVALAREGKRDVSLAEKADAMLLQLLYWFKKSFKWVDQPDCDVCGSASVRTGMGSPTREELAFEANRVELFRCRNCKREIRFPRYNDPMKLLETRSGRCGEWANCFTLYCRALGFQTRLVLDFTDHLWTECFSSSLNRWVHLDPCEAVFDKPLLYEQGWEKKLTYVIAFGDDGVYDVTKRYTRDWNAVLLRRTKAPESVVHEVVTTLTAKARVSKSSKELELLRLRDAKELVELATTLPPGSKQIHLPGRQTGSEAWRLLRGEIGNSQDDGAAAAAEGSSSSSAGGYNNTLRLCVDEHVSKVYAALGSLLKSSEPARVTRLWRRVLEKLKSQPFKSRKELFGKGLWLKEECALPLLQALGLRRDVQETGQVLISLDGDPVVTALVMPVALQLLAYLSNELEKHISPNLNLKLLSQGRRRLSGGQTCASNEQLPLEIASAAFDGVHTTKWGEPKGAMGGWIEYRLVCDCSTSAEMLVGYQITSAEDSPERDPWNWVVEGSNDGGQTWICLDIRKGEMFEERLLKKTYEISQEKQNSYSVFRFRCLSVLDPVSQSRLQISCIDLFVK